MEKEKGVGEKITEAGEEMQKVVNKMIVPALLIILGFMFLPFGIILWIIALGSIVNIFSKK